MNSSPAWKRRAWLAGAGAAALGAGGWVALRRTHHEGPAADGAAGMTPGAAPSTDVPWSWTMSRPDGTSLPLAPLRASGLVLNFWATWCAPCLREFPQLDRFHREMKPAGWQVVAAAVDQPAAVRDFLARTPVSFAVGIGGFEALDVSRALGNTQGGLPFTVVFAPGGRLLRAIVGETDHDTLVAIINRR
jgi:thiol-disulfide isomerase/thioredoxin